MTKKEEIVDEPVRASSASAAASAASSGLADDHKHSFKETSEKKQEPVKVTKTKIKEEMKEET